MDSKSSVSFKPSKTILRVKDETGERVATEDEVNQVINNPKTKVSYSDGIKLSQKGKQEFGKQRFQTVLRNLAIERFEGNIQQALNYMSEQGFLEPVKQSKVSIRTIPTESREALCKMMLRDTKEATKVEVPSKTAM